jgi:spermidine synthase
VHEYATKYFALPANHTPIIADAVKHLDSLARTKQKYDYIVHDVFTGGAEPVDLFTQEFLQDLRHALKPNGAVAIVS